MTLTPQQPDSRLSLNAAKQLLSDSLPARLTAAHQRQTEDIVGWAERSYFVDEPPGLIQLAPHQQAVLRVAEARRPDGRHVFSTVVWSAPKKSGKSTIAGIPARYRAERFPGQEIICAANDLEQAQGRVFRAIETSLGTPPAPGWTGTRRTLTYAPTGSVIRAAPNDFRGEAGANPSLTIWTELWGFKDEAPQRFYAELTPVHTRASQRWSWSSQGRHLRGLGTKRRDRPRRRRPARWQGAGRA